MTAKDIDNLPDMLLTAMRAPCFGMMIARGDLAVECGFERVAEVQVLRSCACPSDFGHQGTGNSCPKVGAVAHQDHGYGYGT